MGVRLKEVEQEIFTNSRVSVENLKLWGTRQFSPAPSV
jgi:hypothetical protein